MIHPAGEMNNYWNFRCLTFVQTFASGWLQQLTFYSSNIKNTVHIWLIYDIICVLWTLCVFCFLFRPTMRWRSSHLPLLLLLFSVLQGVTASGFKICAYNLQKFDSRKASSYRVMHTLTRVTPRMHAHTHKEGLLLHLHFFSGCYLYWNPLTSLVSLRLQVVSRCDITLLQEVMDSDGEAIKSLLASLNRYRYRKSWAQCWEIVFRSDVLVQAVLHQFYCKHLFHHAVTTLYSQRW